MPTTDYLSRGKNRVPYKIKPAPGYITDPMPGSEQAFLQTRSEEESLNYQKETLIGNLDSMGSDFLTLFKILSSVKDKLNNTKKLPFLKKRHLVALRKLSLSVNKINSDIVNEIIPLIDKLGR